MQIKKVTIKHILSLVGLLIFVFLAIGSDDPGNTSKTPRDPNAWKTENNKTMARIMMENFVEKRLKCPSSAEFPGVFSGASDHVTHIGDQTYRINSYVDAQNGFGAMIRTKYTGTIMQTSEDMWQLISLDISN